MNKIFVYTLFFLAIFIELMNYKKEEVNDFRFYLQRINSFSIFGMIWLYVDSLIEEKVSQLYRDFFQIKPFLEYFGRIFLLVVFSVSLDIFSTILLNESETFTFASKFFFYNYFAYITYTFFYKIMDMFIALNMIDENKIRYICAYLTLIFF